MLDLAVARTNQFAKAARFKLLLEMECSNYSMHQVEYMERLATIVEVLAVVVVVVKPIEQPEH